MMVVKQLYAIQELDLELARISRALADAETKLKTEIPANDLEAALKAEEARLLDAQTRQHDNRMQTAVRRDRSESLEARLYDGSIANIRDLEAIRQESASVRRLLEQNEAASLDLSIEIEESETRRAALHQKLSEAQAQQEARRQELIQTINQLRAQQQDRRKRRQALADRIDQPTMERYETLRRAKGGRAVAKVERDLCQGCRMSLPTQLRQRVRTARQTVICSSCGRMLFTE